MILYKIKQPGFLKKDDTLWLDTPSGYIYVRYDQDPTGAGYDWLVWIEGNDIDRTSRGIRAKDLLRAMKLAEKEYYEEIAPWLDEVVIK
jgi:hypothetical protein